MSSELSTSPRRRLPDNWVQKIFSTMQGHYGTRFLNMWMTGQMLPDGQDAGLVNAMNHWAEKLGGYAEHPQTIKKALSLLPPEPPTLPQFCEILRMAFVPPDALLLTQQPTPEEREKAKENIRRIRQMLEGTFQGPMQ